MRHGFRYRVGRNIHKDVVWMPQTFKILIEVGAVDSAQIYGFNRRSPNGGSMEVFPST
jgi:hypothetical protein